MGHDLTLRPEQLPRRALELAESDPEHSLELVERYGAERRSATGALQPEADAASVALVALARGLALQRIGRRPGALACLQEADRLLASAGLPVEAARARVALALELLDGGDVSGALGLLADAGKGLKGAPAARVAMQRALVLQRSGRVADTLEDWTRALRSFQRSGDVAAAARAQGNRGLVRIYRGEYRAAEADLRAAEAAFAQLGDPIGVAEAVHNRGFLAIRRGDLPAGLELFDEAQQGLRALGVARPEMLVDRAETLLAAGVALEARAVAEVAVAELEQAGREADRAEALLLLGQAAEESGDPERAARWAGAARQEFAAQGRPRWELLAAYRQVRAAGAAEGWPAGLIPPLGEMARDLAAAGWRSAAVEADALAVELACLGGTPSSAELSRRRLGAARRHCPPASRLAAWLAEAHYRLEAEDGRGVERALQAALNAAREHQVGLGSSELRTRLADKAAGIVSVGVRHAEATGRPRRALRWMEAARLIQVPGGGRPVEDPQAAAALESLRRAIVDLEREADPIRQRRLRRQQQALEEVVRRRSRYSRPDGDAAGTSEPTTAVIRAVGDRLLVEYSRDRDDLVAVTVSGGEVRLERLGPLAGVRRAVAALRLALRARMTPDASGPGPDLERASGAVDELLVAPVLQHRPGARRVIVVPTGALASVPWGALAGLEEADVVLAPSAGAWARADADWRAVGPEARVLTLAGPGLVHTTGEAEAVAALWRSATVLVGEDATVAACVEEIGRADVLHVAAHGVFRADSPLLSSIRLADGPLTLYELSQLRRLPRLVVLSACNTGRSDAESTGLLGLSAGLQRAGAQSVISSVTPVSDDDSPQMMAYLHGLLHSGADPGPAVRDLNQMAKSVLADRSRGFVTFSSR